MIRILIVENSETERMVIQRNLDKIFTVPPIIGVEYRATDRMQEALYICAEWVPQLVMVDLNLTDSQALTTAPRIAEFQHQPAVIAMTGEDTRELTTACRAAGVDTFVHKDRIKDLPEFASIVSNALARKLSPPLYAR